MIRYANAMYINQTARQKCAHEAVHTTIMPMRPLPARTIANVMQSSPAGLAVVGELNSSKITRRARINFAIELKASIPAKQEHAKWKYSAIL